MPAVESLCGSAILLEKGAVASGGSSREVVERYLQTIATLGTESLADRQDRQGDGRLRFIAIEPSARTGDYSEFRLRYTGRERLRNVAVSVGLFTVRGDGALYLANEVSGDQLPEIPATGTLVCRIDRTPLLPGRYSMNVYCTVNGILADWVQEAAIVEVAEGDFYGTGRLPPPGYGATVVPHAWSVER